jgi:tetratricopeptide (TPR) repeat protein
MLPLLGSIRRAQAMTALEQAASLGPDLEPPHALLVQLYYEQGQMDRALDHLRARLRIIERGAAKGGPGTQADKERLAGLRQDLEALESVVRQSEKIYDTNTADKSAPLEIRDRAALAARHGLTRKALDMLLKSRPSIFGKGGTLMELDLMLKSGQAYEVRDALPAFEATINDFNTYHSLRAQAAAASGDYAAADAELDLLSQQLRVVGIARDQGLPVREAVALQAGRAILAGPGFLPGPANPASVRFQQYEQLRALGGAISLLRQEADTEVLRGLLALETGAVGVAREHFRAALKVWAGEAAAASGRGTDFVTRPVAQRELSLLEE